MHVLCGMSNLDAVKYACTAENPETQLKSDKGKDKHCDAEGWVLEVKITSVHSTPSAVPAEDHCHKLFANAR